MGDYKPAEYDALTIAKWFVAWAAANEADLSNLKLQKLLYYAQGHHLDEYDQPLFSDRIEAWAHGPVVADIYHRFKQFGSADLELPDGDPFTWDAVDEGTEQFLIQVWDVYGGYGAWRLRNMTHKEAPWISAFEPHVNNEIDVPSIHRSFARR